MSPVIESEAMYVNKYVKEFYPKATVLGKTRVGAYPEGNAAYSVILGYPDKIILLPGLVIIVEAKIKPSSAAVGKLEFYGLNFLKTPGFEVYSGFKIELQLVTPIEDPAVREYAEGKGMKYIIYKPKEVNYLLRERFGG